LITHPGVRTTRGRRRTPLRPDAGMREGEPMSEIGPVQMLTLAFGPQADYEGRIVDELVRLQEQGTIRILDLLFVVKDTDSGEIVTVEQKNETLGSVVAGLLGLSGSELGERLSTAEESPGSFGLSRGEIQDVAESLEPGHAAGFLMIEHAWARDLKSAIRDAGGTPVGQDFLTPELVRAVEPELAALADADAGAAG
jgi:uncharacterized membrane protein